MQKSWEKRISRQTVQLDWSKFYTQQRTSIVTLTMPSRYNAHSRQDGDCNTTNRTTSFRSLWRRAVCFLFFGGGDLKTQQSHFKSTIVQCCFWSDCCVGCFCLWSVCSEERCHALFKHCTVLESCMTAFIRTDKKRLAYTLFPNVPNGRILCHCVHASGYWCSTEKIAAYRKKQTKICRCWWPLTVFACSG